MWGIGLDDYILVSHYVYICIMDGIGYKDSLAFDDIWGSCG